MKRDVIVRAKLDRYVEMKMWRFVNRLLCLTAAALAAAILVLMANMDKVF